MSYGPDRDDEPEDLRRHRWPAEFVIAVAVGLTLVIGAAATVSYDNRARGAGARGPAPRAALTAPRCPEAAGSAPSLAAAGRSVRLSRRLTAVQVSRDGRYTFAATGHRVEVLRNRDGQPGRTPVQVIALAAAARGEAVTADGRHLLVAAGSGATVISIRAAEHPGTGVPVIGRLASPAGARAGASAVAVSAAGGRYAFVTLKSAGRVAVFSLARAEASGFARSGFAGFVPSPAPAGIAESPDGRWLYVISKSQGTVSVISQRAAEASPATAVVSSARAGCSPSQVITSAGGSVVWVTARDSNALLGFSAPMLQAGRSHALVAVVPVGQSPVSEVLVDGGREIVTLDVSAFVPGGGNLAVVSTGRALARKRALLRLLRTGLLPVSAVPVPARAGALLLVTFDQSRELRAINVATPA